MSKKSVPAVALGCVVGCLVIVPLVVLGAGFLLYLMADSATLGEMEQAFSGSSAEGGPLLDQPAPLFTSTTVGGEPWSLEAHRGKVVLLDFWASWCVPCIKSLPHLRRIHQTYGGRDDFLMVGVSLDSERDELVGCVEEHGIGWTQLFEGVEWDNPVASLYGVQGIPHVLILDREGVIRSFDPHGARLDRELERILEDDPL